MPANGPSAKVTLRWRLQKDGKLLESPEVVDLRSSPSCAPAERHDVWKVIIWEFDPTLLAN
jgi:hypothetical protein